MEFRPTPDQEALIRDAIDSGRIDRAEDAISQALALWEEQQRGRGEILAKVDAAEASLARGEGQEITAASMQKLAVDVKQRGRARLDLERRQRR